MRISGIAFGLGLIITGCGPKPQGDIAFPESVLLYEAPSTGARILDTIPAGAVAALLRQEGEWTWVCLRGLKGWVRIGAEIASPPSEPLPESILAEKRSDTVLADIGLDGEKSIYLSLMDLKPWFVMDSSAYAGFYEGLPGEVFALLIVNFAPRLSLILRTSEIDAETMDMQESEYVLSGDYHLMGNLILANDPSQELPFRRAEFIYYKGRRGLLVEQAPGTYRLLWRREVFS